MKTIPRIEVIYDVSRTYIADAEIGHEVMPHEFVSRYNELATLCESLQGSLNICIEHREMQDKQLRKLRRIEE